MTDKEKIARRQRRFLDDTTINSFEGNPLIDPSVECMTGEDLESYYSGVTDRKSAFDALERARHDDHWARRGPRNRKYYDEVGSDDDDEAYTEYVKSVQKDEEPRGEKYYYDDAIGAVQNGLDFHEWYPAFFDELEPEEAERIFISAYRKYNNMSEKPFTLREDNYLNTPNINRDMMRDFTKPKLPTRTIAKNPYYRDVEELSPEELSKDKVRFNKIPKGYDGECYVIFLDDMLSFSGLGDFNPKGKNAQHYQVVKCDNVKDAQTVAKNGSRDEMRLLGISCDMPKFRKTASFSIKNAEDCPLWLPKE